MISGLRSVPEANDDVPATIRIWRLAVGIAWYVLDVARARGLFVEARQRTIGKIWSIAQVSGSGLEQRELQKYLSGIIFEIFPQVFRAHVFIVDAISPTDSRAIRPEEFFGSGRCPSGPSRPRLKRSSASSAYLAGHRDQLVEKADMVEWCPISGKVRAPSS